MVVTKRKLIRIISYLVAVSVIFAATGLFSQRAKAGYEETLGKVRMTNLGSMCEYFRDISAGLRLLAVSADSSLSDSISYVEARVMGAKSCLNGFNAKKVKNIGDFLDTANKFTQDFSGTSEKRKIAVYLSEYAQEVYYHLDDVTSGIANGAYSLTEYGSIYRNEEKPYFEEFVDYSNGNEKELFDAAAPVSANENGTYPDERENITEETAKKIAGEAAGINPVLWRNNGENEAFYSFCHGDVAVDISKSGLVCKLINPMPCRKAVYSLEESQKTAIEFLEKHGFGNMTAVKRENSEFTADFLFYPHINGVLIMTSPVTIELCRSSGAVVYFDSCQYIRNFRKDVFPPANLPDVSAVLPENLVLKQSLFCVAEIDGKEKICVLSVCEYNDYNFYIYTDPESMKILKTENA